MIIKKENALNIELDEKTRNTVVGAINWRLRKILNSTEPHHVAETKTLFEASKKMGF